MNRQIAVNPGQIVINDGSTFLVTAADGDVDDRKAQGLFARDTRLVSYYRLYVNRQRLTLLASSCIDHHSARYVYTNAELNAIGGRLPQNSLLIALRRDIAGGMHEDVDVTNWHREPIDVDLALAIRSDFADLFQVKANDVLTHGDITTQWEDDRLNIDYQSGSFRCGLSITCEREDSPLRNANGRLSFRIKLRPGERWHTCLKYAIRFDEQSIEPQSTCRQSHDTAGGRIKDEFVASATRIKSSNRAVDQAYSQAIQDMGALRLKISFKERNCWMPAAGVPWFMAVFGRDSIIVSLQSLAVHREFAAAWRKVAHMSQICNSVR